MKSMIKDAGVLLIITLTAGLLLGFIYQLTKEPIALAQEQAAQDAYRDVFESAYSFKEIDEDTYRSIVDPGSWKNQGLSGVDIGTVMQALDETDSVLGYVLVSTSHEGYGGDISIAVGIQNDGTVNGISILSISETAGLGMKAEEVLQPQFTDKNVENFVSTKEKAVMENQIDAISGATVTTDAVTNAVNAGLYCFKLIIQEGAGND